MPRRKANGEGSIIQLPNGKYKATMTVDIIYNPDNTVQKQNRKTFTHEKKRECQKWLNEQINQKQKNTLVTPSKMTVEKWLNIWLEKYKKHSLKIKTFESYKQVIDSYIVPKIGKKHLQDLKTKDLQGMYTDLVNEGKSKRTAEYTHVVIHNALKQALKEDLIAKNVANTAQPPRKEKKEMRVLSQEEIKKLLEANKDHKLYPLLLLELGTGLRVSELLALHWNNIDLEKGSVQIVGNIVESKEGVKYQAMPKTKSSIRNIPLPIEVVNGLQEYRDKIKPNDKDIVFLNTKGTYIRPCRINQTFKTIWLKKAGLQPINFHSLRHTHATQLLAHNVHAKIIQQRLGHSNIATTMDIYSHALPSLQKEAADKINEVLKL